MFVMVVAPRATSGHYAAVTKPTLRPNEREIATYRANRSQGFRAVGGHLLLTDQRVVFYPHGLDGATGGKRWECALSSLSGVCMSARGFNPFNGSLRPRLQIDGEGVTEYFAVNKGFAIVDAIKQASGH
jgi:hypothetical protein